MICVKLKGGLGNQMFQYSLGRNLAIKNKTDLLLDISGLRKKEGVTPRKYELNNFRIKAVISADVKLQKNYNNFWDILKPYHYRHIIKERGYNFDNRILELKDNHYLDGYWQSERYFKNISDILQKEFILKKEYDFVNKPEIFNSIRKSNSISVHIRRGDYVLNNRVIDFHGSCSLNYYYKTIDEIANKIKNPHFYFFSDDISWVKNNIKIKYSHNFIEGNKNCVDLFLMSQCKHNIIANSSFSWWGAWLNKNSNKIVFSPRHWFEDQSINTSDLILNSWNTV